jgi:prepilin signal peptidase PulO-like enzyme (type II secretory pathway)
VNFWLNLPLDARYAALAVAGALLGGLVNLGASALSYDARPSSPWLALDVAGRAPRRWLDRLPLVGWLRLRRESDLFGRWHWVRPIVVEVALAAGLPLLYWWEVVAEGLWMNFPGAPPGFLPRGFVPETNLALAAHAMFACHALLGVAMLTASLIDIDERLIPDGVTVPGTLVGLLTAAIYPWSRLPAGLLRDHGVLVVDFMKVTSPIREPWPQTLGEAPHVSGLAIGLGCYAMWIVALLPRPWRMRRGLGIALRLFWVRFREGLFSWQALALLFAGAAGITFAWQRGGPEWIGLASALVGMAAAGGMVWIVRVLGSVMLRREAMGFGDVTLMAMIGAFLGWQICLLTFFLAPLFALAFGVVQLAVRRDNEIYYGPFLCLAAAVLTIRWRDVWSWAWPMFELGWLVPAAMGVAMVAMVVLLAGIRWVRGI